MRQPATGRAAPSSWNVPDVTGIVTALLVLAVLSARAHAVDITACGTPVRGGQVGVLLADLDCSGIMLSCNSNGAAACVADPSCTDAGCGGVILGDRATLQMNGHTIANGAIFCAGKCAISGPGTITGGDYPQGESLTAAGDLEVDGGLDIHGTEFGIRAIRTASLSDVSVSNCSNVYGAGIEALKRLTLTNVMVSDNAGAGIDASRAVRGEVVTVNGNARVGIEIERGGLKVTGLMAMGNGGGVSTGLGGVSVGGGSVKLYNSVVTGNFAGAIPLDLSTLRRPLLVSSTCDHSQRLLRHAFTSETWGVCSQD
jgi:hypothetical protein